MILISTKLPYDSLCYRFIGEKSQKGQLTQGGRQAHQLEGWALEHSSRFESGPVPLKIWLCLFLKFSYKLLFPCLWNRAKNNALLTGTGVKQLQSKYTSGTLSLLYQSPKWQNWASHPGLSGSKAQALDTQHGSLKGLDWFFNRVNTTRKQGILRLSAL